MRVSNSHWCIRIILYSLESKASWWQAIAVTPCGKFWIVQPVPKRLMKGIRTLKISEWTSCKFYDSKDPEEFVKHNCLSSTVYGCLETTRNWGTLAETLGYPRFFFSTFLTENDQVLHFRWLLTLLHSVVLQTYWFVLIDVSTNSEGRFTEHSLHAISDGQMDGNLNNSYKQTRQNGGMNSNLEIEHCDEFKWVGLYENVFGILLSRFRFLDRKLAVKLGTLNKLVSAACALHNWLVITSKATCLSGGATDEENNETGEIIPGRWRSEIYQRVERSGEIRRSSNNNIGQNKSRTALKRTSTMRMLFPGNIKPLLESHVTRTTLYEP